LESVANAHTAADLHVHPWVSNRADLESRECRERLRNTPRAISDNPLIRRRRASLRRCCSAAIPKAESKFLDSCVESRAPCIMTNPAAPPKNFHKIFTCALGRTRFQTTCARYGDKWLAKRSFSRLFFRVTPERPLPSRRRSAVQFAQQRFTRAHSIAGATNCAS